MHEVESLAYYGETPWHTLGKRLIVPPKTVEEAIIEGGLNWPVALAPLLADFEGEYLDTDHYAVIRTTDKMRLGIVGSGYTPMQNHETFKFFQPVMDTGKVAIETVGSLRGGRRVFMLARVNNACADVVKGDEVRAFFLLSNSHDGTVRARLGFTETRVVCMNTLGAAHKGDLLSIRHTKNAVAAIKDVHDLINWTTREFEGSVQQMQALARKGVTPKTLRKFVRDVFRKDVEETTVGEDQEEQKFARLEATVIPLFEQGRGNDLPGVRGTMWAAYNAVSEYLTWERGHSIHTRLDSLWFGDSAKLNQKAFKLALAA